MKTRITNLARSPHGYWAAQLVGNGQAIDVDTRFGSWMTVPDEAQRCREVLPHVAALLQERVRKLERQAVRSAA